MPVKVEITLDKWSDFGGTIRALLADAENWTEAVPFLYRGQSNAHHVLNTTLERYRDEPMSVVDYYRKAHLARPQIEAFIERQWTIPNLQEYAEQLKAQLFPQPLPEASYLAYLRHHGYPSPLLDWTRSPYVAAFFAYANGSTGANRVAVYVYRPSKYGIRSGSDSEPEIYNIGPYVRTHRRHFLQQSDYTFCVQLDQNGHWIFVPHEAVFTGERHSSPATGGDQDLLWKITMPTSDRIAALRELESYNITQFSLLPSEESLLATIALHEFHFRD